MLYRVFEQARQDLSFDIRPVIDRFSLITLALNSPSIRAFIGVPSYKEVTFQKALVPDKKLKNLELLLTWIYGNAKDKMPILSDSRQISGQLAAVLSDSEATKYLITYGNLGDAYERSGGEREFVKQKVNAAKKNTTSALQAAYKYKGDRELIALVEELGDAVDELKKAISKK